MTVMHILKMKMMVAMAQLMLMMMMTTHSDEEGQAVQSGKARTAVRVD